MKKRKTLAMGLAVAMAVSCLAGCGGDDKKASSDGKTEQVLNIRKEIPIKSCLLQQRAGISVKMDLLILST